MVSNACLRFIFHFLLLQYICLCAFFRIPEFKSFEELELPKHSKVKRQTSTPNASDLEQQPEINIEEWLHKSTFEILQKFNVSLTILPMCDYEFHIGALI